MRYTAYSEEQIKSMSLLEAGTYTFEVVEVSETDQHKNSLIDKDGYDYARLKLKIVGLTHPFHINTILGANPKIAYKLRGFCETVDLLSSYEEGNLDLRTAIKRRGLAKIVVRKSRPRPDGGEWPAQNEVSSFVQRTNKMDVLGQKTRQKEDEKEPFDDAIPF